MAEQGEEQQNCRKDGGTAKAGRQHQVASGMRAMAFEVWVGQDEQV